MTRKGIHNVIRSPNGVRGVKYKMLQWAGDVARMEERRNLYRNLVKNEYEQRILGRLRRSW